MANQNATPKAGRKTRTRRDPTLVFSETACRSARQAASLAAARVSQGHPAPAEVLENMSNLQGSVMVWLNSQPEDE